MADNFAYFEKPIGECSDQELTNFYIAFCNGADPKRGKEFQDTVTKIDSIL